MKLFYKFNLKITPPQRCVFLVFSYEFNDVLVLLWSYMFIYNLSLFIIFYTLFQFTSFDLKTTHSLNDLGSNNYFSKVLIISLFSMAGVPPFWGFFSKIFIFTLLCNSHFFILFPFFFFILFLGLYFYIQNIRFLNATNGSNYQPSFEQGVRIVPIYYYTINLFLFFIIFGFMFTEDLLLVMSWILL